MTKRNTPVTGGLTAAQFVLDTMVLSIKKMYASHDVYRFGQQLAWISGETLANAVVCHRLTKAYEVPQEGLSTERKARSIAKVLETDAKGFLFDPFADREVTRVFLRARYFLSTICDHFRPTYNLVFPTGEASTTSRGWKDLYYKLENEALWECSPESFKYVAEIFYRNVHMKRLVKAKYYARALREFGRTRRDCSRRNYESFGTNGRRTFRHMLSLLVTLRCTSRMTTVPKDNLNDRVITCEPFLTMICQLSFMADMRVSFQRTTGLDLRSLQDWHKAKLRLGHATIDLKSASDKLWNNVVKALFPPRFNRYLQALRTGVTEHGGSYHHFNMFSPMGCGLTFDVMTWVLTGLCRAYDERATVFGDDIMVITAKAGRQVCNILPSFGFQVNSDKSFVVGNFRESCGAFADLTRDSFITCYELTRPTNIPECIAATNKLRVILDADQVSSAVKQVLQKAWEALIHFLPRDAVKGGSAYVTDRFILVEDGNRPTRVTYNKDLQRLQTITNDYYLYRRPQPQPVDRVLDAVRMMTLREPVLLGASEAVVRYRKYVD